MNQRKTTNIIISDRRMFQFSNFGKTDGQDVSIHTKIHTHTYEDKEVKLILYLEI